MPGESLIVFERRPRWLPELQRQFLQSSINVKGCASVRGLWEAVRDDGSLIVLVLDGAQADGLAWLVELADRHKPPKIIVIGTKQTNDLEWPVRESGVTAFLPDDISGGELAVLCRRLLADD